MADAESTPPEPPYWAVVFSSVRRGRAVPEDDDAYQATAGRMEELAAAVPGFLGIESARDGGGAGITVSYWASPDSIAQWRRDLEHVEAQDRGRERWYERFEVRIARVERAYGWDGVTGWTSAASRGRSADGAR